MSLNISDFSLAFFVKIATPPLPWQKLPPLFQQPLSQSWGPVKPPLFQNLVRGSTRSPLPPSAERKWGTLWTCGQLYLNQCQENFFINNHLLGFGRTVEIVRKKSGKAVSYKIKFMHTDTFKFHVGQIIVEYKIKLFKENKTTKEK